MQILKQIIFEFDVITNPLMTHPQMMINCANFDFCAANSFGSVKVLERMYTRADRIVLCILNLRYLQLTKHANL